MLTGLQTENNFRLDSENSLQKALDSNPSTYTSFNGSLSWSSSMSAGKRRGSNPNSGVGNLRP
jgi:hypothetical protein